MKTPAPWIDALGASDIFLAFQERLASLAQTERPLLVIGERGTGKELAVQRLHYLSPRWDKPFVTVLCPALSPTLLESELFGYEAGAFTGARGRRVGYFERADCGTIFLDEVADMPLALQDKLLRVIEYGTFERVGGSAPVEVDVRIVAATNRDLPALAAEGKFRPDLLDRLAFEVAHVPPLRLRGDDRLLLAKHFATKAALEMNIRRTPPIGMPDNMTNEILGAGPVFGARAILAIETYDWPGNIRELKNAVERSLLHYGLEITDLAINPFVPDYQQGCPQTRLQAGPQNDLPPENLATQGMQSGSLNYEQALTAGFSLKDYLLTIQVALLQEALKKAKFNQTKAAELLGINYNQFRALYRKCKSHL